MMAKTIVIPEKYDYVWDHKNERLGDIKWVDESKRQACINWFDHSKGESESFVTFDQLVWKPEEQDWEVKYED